jgi:alpha-ketoglutarate-dependent taurine dioxygenase
MITPLSSHTGADVTGVDLTQPVDAALRERLNRAFVEHSVLVVRDQHLSPPQLLAAVQLFGEVFPQHNTRFALPECPQIHTISNQDFYPDGKRYIPGEGYHTDHSNAAEPPKATVLHAVRLPDRGGDTQFVNMQRAYEDLPAAMQQRIDGLRAMHVYQSRHSERKLMALSATARQKVPDAVLHPLVRTHPETGRRALYLNPIRIEAIEGMAETEALALLDELLAHATQPQYEYRHQWRPGDMVMWDNRCLLHKANGDYDMGQVRYLYRIMLKGDAPV